MISSSWVTCASSSATRSFENRSRISSGNWGRVSASFTATTASTYGSARSSPMSLSVCSVESRTNSSACWSASAASRGSVRWAASSARRSFTRESGTGSGMGPLGLGDGPEMDGGRDQLFRLAAVEELDPVGAAGFRDHGARAALVPGVGLAVRVGRLDADRHAVADLERPEEPVDGGHPLLPDLLRERPAAAGAESLRTLHHGTTLPYRERPARRGIRPSAGPRPGPRGSVRYGRHLLPPTP